MTDWHSLHIFYFQQQDRLLLDCIKPIVRSLSADQKVQQYFFIRFLKEGPHVRLRLKVESDHAARVMNEVKDALQTYLTSVPSSGSYIEQFRNLPSSTASSHGYFAVDDWGRDNHIINAEYVPELGRYGGETGIEIAEAFFMASSELAFDLIDQIANKKVDRNTVALQMIWGLAGEFCHSKEHMNHFLRWYYMYTHSALGGNHLSKQIFDGARNTFSRIRPVLHKMMAKTLNDRGLFTSKHLTSEIRTWCQLAANVYEELVQAIDCQAISLDQHFTPDLNENMLSAKDKMLCSLASSYIHMMNNRLGVSITAECSLTAMLLLLFSHNNKDTGHHEIN